MSNPVVTTAGYEPATSAPILLRRSALNYVVIMVEQTRFERAASCSHGKRPTIWATAR